MVKLFFLILKAVKREMEPYLQGKIVKTTADFSSKSMEARMGWHISQAHS